MELRMNIKDKTDVKGRKGTKLFCPPHCWPHKPPFSKPITTESCHYHNRKWRMAHHYPFCYLLKCKNFDRMMEQYREDKKLKKDWRKRLKKILSKHR